MLELYNWTFQSDGKKIHIFMWNQILNEQILDVNSVQFTIFIKSQYCSKCNPNLASKKKKYSNSKTVLQYSNKKKSAREPKENSAIHTFESPFSTFSLPGM